MFSAETVNYMIIGLSAFFIISYFFYLLFSSSEVIDKFKNLLDKIRKSK